MIEYSNEAVKEKSYEAELWIEIYKHLFTWLSSSFTGKFKPSIVRLYNI